MQVGQVRGQTRGVLGYLCFLFSFGFRSILCCKFGFPCLVNGRMWWVNGSLIFRDRNTVSVVQNAIVRAIIVLQESGVVSFGSVLGPYAGAVKRVLGVGGGTRISCFFSYFFDTFRERKDSSKTLVITAGVCRSQTSFLWHCGFEASDLSHSDPTHPTPSRLGQYRESRVWGGAHALARREGVPA